MYDPSAPCYGVVFKIRYKTKIGEKLCVVGSIHTLGNWTEFKCHLTWTNDHVWTSVKPVLISEQEDIFQYKYVVLHENDHRLLDFEKGLDRVADLKILPEIKSPKEDNVIKNVELVDTWEKFKLKLSVFYPQQDQIDVISVRGSCPELGGWNAIKDEDILDSNKIKMNQPGKYEIYYQEKYGKDARPWELNMTLLNEDWKQTLIKGLDNIKYQYQTHNQVERLPCRVMAIQDSKTYTGQLRDTKYCTWIDTDMVWIVNGELNKADLNFRRVFHINEIEMEKVLADKKKEGRLFIGSKPETN